MESSGHPGEEELIETNRLTQKFTKMKIFKCSMACALMILFSCSTEETFYLDQVDTTDPFSKELLPLPNNNNNPYDWVGELYRQTFEQYMMTGNYSSREQLERAVSEYFLENNALTGKEPVPALHQSNKMDGEQTLEGIISGSGLSPAAQANLLDFIETVLVVQDDGYGVLYGYFTGYESLVTGNLSFTERDKQVILTFTSLVRYGSYPYSTVNTATEDEPDDDWNNTVGNMIGYIEIALAENP